MDPLTFVGNVYGVVSDATGASVAGAQVSLLEKTDRGVAMPFSEDASSGWPSRPNCGQPTITGRTVRSAITGSDGSFLINSVPTPGDGVDYTLAIAHASHLSAVFDVRVLPGATMALEVRARLETKESGFALGSSISIRYRHEAVEPGAADSAGSTESGAPGPIRATTFRGSIFATREGLVGGTTANGHIIVTNDRFVALPSRRALSSNFGHEREVRLSYRGRTSTAPVWDVGPWNTRDDYWNPPNIRERFQDLPMGKPEAEAAFYDRYNGGLDGSGRAVKNPAGIDLADGTFWLDLGMTNNDRVEVEYLWVDSAGPLISAIAVSPDPALTGSTIAIKATASDAATGNAPITAAEFFFDIVGDSGTGTSADPADGNFDAPEEMIRSNVKIALLPEQRHTIFVHARDVYGNWGPFVATTFSVVKPPRQRAVNH